MTPVLALLRRQWLESRWVLGLMTLAFLGLAILTAWLTWRFEHLIALGELGPAVRRYRFLRALGGENMDYSTTALEICWWNHPLIVLTVLGWAISRGAATVAGEIERGVLDLSLSRPLSRSTYLLTQMVFMLLGLLVLAAALIVGCQVGAQLYPLKEPPTILTLLKPSAMLVTLGMAVYGYTLPFSALDSVRWRPGVIASALTLGGLIAITVAPQFEGYDWLERLSVFRAYAPVTVALKGEPLTYNALVLCGVFAAGVVLALGIFSRRDLPSNS